MATISKLSVSLTAQTSVFEARMRRARKKLGAFQTSMNRASKFVRGFGTSLLGISVGVGGIAVFGIAMRGAIRVSAEFEQQMSRVRAVSGASQVEFMALSDSAKELGRSTQFSATQAASAMNEFALQGFTVNQMLQAVGPSLNLAAVGGISLADASQIAAGVLRGMQLDVSQTTRVIDVLAKTMGTSANTIPLLGEAFSSAGPAAVQFGASLEETSAAIGILANNMIRGDKAGTALRNLFLRLQAQPSEVRKALNELGVSVVDLRGQMKPLSQLIDEINNGLAGRGVTDRQALLAAVAGLRAIGPLNILLDQGGDALRKYEGELRNAFGTSAQQARTMLDNLSGDVTLFKSAAEGLGISLGESMNPALRETVTSATVFMQAVGGMVSNLDQATTSTEELTMAGVRNNRMWADSLGTVIDAVAWLWRQLRMAQTAALGIGKAMVDGVAAAKELFGIDATKANIMSHELGQAINANLDEIAASMAMSPSDRFRASLDKIAQDVANAQAGRKPNGQPVMPNGPAGVLPTGPGSVIPTLGDGEDELGDLFDDDLKDIARRAARIFEQTRTPMERYESTIGELNDLVSEGAIDWETYGRAVRDARQELEETTSKASGLDDLQNQARGVFESTRTSAERYQSAIETLNSLVRAGSLDWDTYRRGVMQAKEEFLDLTRTLSGGGRELGRFESVSTASPASSITNPNAGFGASPRFDEAATNRLNGAALLVGLGIDNRDKRNPLDGETAEALLKNIATILQQNTMRASYAP